MTSAKHFFNWFKEAGRGHLTTFLAWGAFCIYGMIKAAGLNFNVYTYTGIGSTELLYICAGLGAAIGFLEFFYLLQPKKLDFYYSLPVRKGYIFWSRYLHGLFHFLLPLSLVLSILSIYQSSMDSAFSFYILSYPAKSMFVCLMIFLLFYHIVICSVILCGNMVASLLLSVGFLSYFQLLLNYVFLPLITNCFQTYYRSPLLESLLAHLVPIQLCQILCGTQLFDKEQILSYTPKADIILGILVWNTVLFLIMTMGQKRRKPEMIGRIFTFGIAERIVQILLTFLGGLLCGAFLLDIMHLTPANFLLWGIVFFSSSIIACALIHFLLEWLVQESHRVLLRRKAQPFLTAFAVLITGFLFLAYAPVYDTYFPESQKVSALSISVAGLDMDGDTYSQILYGDSYPTEQQLKQYCFTEDAKALGMSWISSVIESNKQVSIDGQFLSKDSAYTTVTICYHMEHGQKYYRVYPLSKEMFAAFASVYEADEYKKAAYPASSPTYLADTGKDLFTWSDGVSKLPLKLSAEDKQNLLRAYAADIQQLKMQSLTQTVPAGILSITSQQTGYVQELPIYPFFTQTCSLLTDFGTDTDKTIADYPIASIEIHSSYAVPADSSGGTIHHFYETPEEIEKWKYSLVPETFDIQPLLTPLTQEGRVKIENTETTSYNEIKCRLK
ncbi:DUF6449 domain-containing protein [Mediterraneibacter massiliensis]|uniref:DUF6449 domain-containing protein n=1 Tax=Mediterraneibacter massiliensis TaxID=1720300 RepID=UPI0024AD6F12|nr:DUF6449 domain-containing protein [Mediterraneibacter massiliensis]